MDEKNTTPANGTPEGAKKNDHHKRHRNRHKHRGPKPEGTQASQQANAAAVASQPNNPPKKEQNTQPKQSNYPHGDHNRQQKKNGQSQNGDKNQQNRKDQKKRKYQSGGNINTRRGPEDLYGHPTEDDVLTMDELRARIVLKTADGSIPSKKETAPEATDIPQPISPDLLIPMDPDPAATTSKEDCVEVVGVRFRTSGKIYYFDPKKHRLKHGQYAIVETARGPEFGEITFGNRMVKKSATISPLRPVLRPASEADIAHNLENLKKEQEALEVCRKKVLEHRLEMKLIDVQYAFDNSKLVFYFTSEGRVDFRELVKDLASVFHTRIELRQIGIRDEAKMLGGLGACGRPLCCATFLPDFVQVSIKMAKEQGLSLNSAKISGVCGRLMCCLRYESEVYAEEIKRTPPLESTVNTPDGVGTVIGMSPLAGTVKVLLKSADTPPKVYRRDEVTVLGKERSAEKKSEKADEKKEKTQSKS